MENTPILFIVSVVLFLISAITILMPLYLYRRNAARCSETAEAEIIANRYMQRVKRAGGTSSRPLYAPVYEYRYGGKTYRAEAAIATPKLYPIIYRSTVQVNPDNPREIMTGHDRAGYHKIALCGIFPLCFAIGVLVLAVTAA